MRPLPLKCDVRYKADFLTAAEAEALFSELTTGFNVTNKVVKMADGNEAIAETGTYLFADSELTSFEAFPEVWGGRSPWPASLARVRDRIKNLIGIRFHVARSVFYRDGSEGVMFHQDLPAYGSTAAIASLSLGAEREFVLRSVSDSTERFKIRLASGSLIFMGEGCQDLYEHAIPLDPDCTEPRLNLTFRRYGWEPF